MERSDWQELILEAVEALEKGEQKPMDEILDIIEEYVKIETMIRKEALAHGRGCSGVVEWLIKMEKAYQYED